MLALKKSARMVADLVFLIVMVTTTMPTIIQGLPQLDISGLVGQTIRLPCNVNMEKCGNLHSIKWYRGSSRIFVFSEMAKIARSEGDYVERAELHYTPNSTVSELEVKQLQVADEAVYKCEITYIEVREGCAVVQFINLTALIKPEYVKVTKGDGTELTNATLIGPYTEGDELTLVCESGGGKPIPSVSWWNGTHKMAGEYTAESGPNSVGTGRNRVHMTLGRGDLGAKYECRAENAALNAPIVSNIRVEVNVRPLKLELSGLEHHVVQGTIVVLKCDVIGARPKANITWYNGTKALPEGGPIVTSYDLQEDGTSSTQSRLEFTASRFENGGLLMCEGSNPVMTSRDEKPLRDTINLEVLYPPIVTLSPENVTVDEGQDFHLYLEYQSNPAALKVVRWYREGIEVVSSSDHYEGGTTDFYNLSIRNSTRYDQGVYTVVLENEVGASEPNDAIYVSIYFKPTVSLTMETSTLTPTPVRELDRMNITLVCRVEQGNPDLLIGVRWYLGGELLKELPDCEGGNATSPASAASDLTFCDIDPSRLLLENVGRGFHGNYSCEGRNEAGWGPLSQDQELVVYYPPGPSTLVYEPREVVKKGTVTLRCTVEEPGYPETSTFKWMRGTHHIPNVTSASLTNPVTLETESNFTCLAYNEGGEGEPATIYIDVLAPPAFIGRLPLYHGALVTAQNVSVSCRVECSPLCAVHWLKNGQHLGDTSRAGSQYRVNNTVLPPDTRSGDFESTLSTLVWNMAAWPGGRLDRIHDNDNYTCQSDDNIAGPGVRSSTIFRVEYPPENITVSNKRVNVTETDVPEWVICNAKAYPEAMYQWYKDGERNTTVLKGGNTLILSGPLKKERGGNYTCEAFNRHGNITQKTFINVLYKPQCGITQSDQDGKLVLVCTADANPTDVDFTWRIKNENDTIEENIEKRGLQSFLTLDTYVETFRTYLCFANNSVGMSIPCERDVTGHLGWWRMENENMIIVVAVVIGGIIMVLIICVIIIIVCRRKRADDKYPNPSTTKDKSKPDLVSSPSDGMLQPDGDKAFYENLPFHGMQSAPNKPITPSLSSKHQHHHHTLVSRPSSQLSHNGSSGYGSTRSHVGPHQSGAALTANKCQSLSRVHTRRRGHISGHFPQFYSLRLHKRHRDKSPKDSNKHPNKSVPKEERVFELHAMPIKESSPEGKSSLQGNEMNNNEEDRKGNNPDIAKEKELGLSQLSLSPPVPAPRKQSPNKAVKHTYQNVPIPITPNSQELTSFQNQHHHHHHYQHHHYNFTSSQHHLLTPPSNNHPYPVGSLKRSSVANRTHLPRPPVRLEYQQPFHVTDSVVYADLALVNGRREPHYPPYYRPPPPQQAPTEYAILKFHDVGQEIDV